MLIILKKSTRDKTYTGAGLKQNAHKHDLNQKPKIRSPQFIVNIDKIEMHDSDVKQWKESLCSNNNIRGQQIFLTIFGHYYHIVLGKNYHGPQK